MSVSTRELYYSIRLAQPFVEMARAAFGIAPSAQELQEGRIEIGVAHDVLAQMVHALKDSTIGLRAGQNHDLGDAGAIDYAMRSAADVRASLAVCARYIRLLNDALVVRIEESEGRAMVHLDSRVALPPVAEDFMMSAMFHVHIRRVLPQQCDLTCLFVRAEPPELGPYRERFSPFAVRFGQPRGGFSFAAQWLDRPLPTAEPALHALLVDQAEHLLSELPATSSTTDRVRQLIDESLPRGGLTQAKIATRLHISSRTLARKLEGEATTFGDVLDQTRLERACQHLDNAALTIEQVAFLVGFSQPTSFYRAFRRWTGQTPQAYRSRVRR